MDKISGHSHIRKEQHRIHESDVVSGHQYLKLIKDFKDYESKLKNRINCLEEKILEQDKLIDSITTHDPGQKRIVILKKKIERLRKLNAKKDETIHHLKMENQRLLLANISFVEQIKNL